MYEAKLHKLSIFYFVLLAALTQWFCTEEGAWYKGLIFFVILAYYAGPNAIDKYSDKFYIYSKNTQKAKALLIGFKVWMHGSFYFLIFSIPLSLISAYALVALEISPDITFVTAFIASLLIRFFGLLFAFVILTPLVLITAYFIYKKIQKIISGEDNSHAKMVREFEEKQRLKIEELRKYG